MAQSGIRVHIYGDYDNKDIAKAQRDLESLKTGASGATPAMGGLNKAMLAFGGIAAGVVSVGALKDFAGQAIDAARESELTIKRLDQIASSMGVLGPVLGGTTKRLQDYAQTLQDQTGVNDETVKSGQAILLTFQSLANTAGQAGGMFDRATAALLDLSAAGFGDAESNAKSLGRALQDPIKGLTALTRQGVTFTDAEKEKVKALVASNQTLAAQNVIMSAVEHQVGGTAAAVATDFDKIGAAVDDLKEKIGYALVGTLDDLSASLGGSQGAIDGINMLGDELADVIRQSGQAVTALAKVAKALGGIGQDSQEAAWWQTALGNTFSAVGGTLKNLAAGPLYWIGGSLDALTPATEELSAANAALAARYAGLTTSAWAAAQALEAARAAAANNAVADRYTALAVHDYGSSITFTGGTLHSYISSLHQTAHATTGVGSATSAASSAIQDASDAAKNAVQGWLDRLHSRLDAARSMALDWRSQMIGLLSLDKAFSLANDKDAAEAQALQDLTDAQNAYAEAQANAASGDGTSASVTNAAANLAKAQSAYQSAAAAAATSWVDEFRTQLSDASNFMGLLQQLKSSGASQALVEQIAAAGPMAGAQMAKDIIADGLIPELDAQLASNDAQATALGVDFANTWGNQLGPNLGNLTAQKAVDAFEAMLTKDGIGKKRLMHIMDVLSADLSRTIDLNVNVHGGGINVTGHRAAGGPVIAGGSYVVGERGPEIVTMGGNGYVTPNSALRSASGGGNSLYVTIQALPGQDYRRLGAEFVEGVGAWVAANGPLPATWVAAS